MHEISLACDILRVIEATAARENFFRVAQIQLEIGSLASVEQQALRFALTAMAHGTCLEGSEITINEVHGVAHCIDCQASVGVTTHFDACPKCGGHALQATKGFDVRIADLVVFND